MATVVHFKAGPFLPITETWIYSQIENLSRYRPVVYAMETMNLDIFPTDKIRRLASGVRFPLFSRLRFHASLLIALAKDRPDLVHAHFGPSGYAFLLARRLLRIPLITSFYGYDINQLPQEHPEWKERYKALFRVGDLFLVEGAHMKHTLTASGCPEDRVLIQRLGIDLKKIRFAPRTQGADEPVKVLMAASFREKKGLVYGVEALGRIIKKRPGLRLQMTILGDSSGNPREEIQKRKIIDSITRLGITDNIVMRGYVPYPAFLEELYRHHIFLAPSVHAADGDSEGGLPVSVLEASASGMPVVSTTHCDIPESIIDGETGYLAPESDVEALAAKLEVPVLNPASWERMGRSGRAHMETNYDVRIQAQRLEEIYDTLLMH